jgi:hypothetical protein
MERIRPKWRIKLGQKEVYQYQADYLTRNIDHGDYTLNMALFLHLQELIKPLIVPTWDIIASLGNRNKKNCHKIPTLGKYKNKFSNMLTSGNRPMLCKPTLENDKPVANETKTKSTPQMLANSALLGFNILVSPFSKTSGTLKHNTHHPPFRGMFFNCLEEEMPPPRWHHLLSIVLSGKCWREGKSQIKASQVTWPN